MAPITYPDQPAAPTYPESTPYDIGGPHAETLNKARARWLEELYKDNWEVVGNKEGVQLFKKPNPDGLTFAATLTTYLIYCLDPNGVPIVMGKAIIPNTTTDHVFAVRDMSAYMLC